MPYFTAACIKTLKLSYTHKAKTKLCEISDLLTEVPVRHGIHLVLLLIDRLMSLWAVKTNFFPPFHPLWFSFPPFFSLFFWPFLTFFLPSSLKTLSPFVHPAFPPWQFYPNPFSLSSFKPHFIQTYLLPFTHPPYPLLPSCPSHSLIRTMIRPRTRFWNTKLALASLNAPLWRRHLPLLLSPTSGRNVSPPHPLQRYAFSRSKWYVCLDVSVSAA